jgi:phage baseplate assembly protein W
MTGPGDRREMLGRGIGFPPRIGANGRLEWSVGSESVRESIRLILLTDAGERLMRPAFGAGLRGFLFEANVPAAHRLMQERIVRALGRWEPRIAVSEVQVEEDARDPERAAVTISYEHVATAEQGQVQLAVRLAG